jgi:hypothetical protein
MDKLTESVVTIGTAIIGVAILSVLVSRQSNTAGVMTAAGKAFSGALGAATAPVTGGGGMGGYSSNYATMGQGIGWGQ